MRLIVKGKDWHCNIPVTKVELDGDVVFAWRGEQFAGMFDLGTVDCVWVSECGETRTEEGSA